jgi:NTP pyrophosphatase (non-canonical NTP hydrolase)
MIDALSQAAKTDARLAAMLEEAREYAQIYLLAKERKKGCEGTGELVTLREEFRDVLAKLGSYCREKGYPCDIAHDDPEAAVRELTK